MAREARRNLAAFLGAYAWLLADLLAFSRGRVFAVVALNLLGVALQWTVVGAVLLFVGELTGEGGAFQVPLLSGVDLPVEASFGVVAAWSIIVLSIVVAATASTYCAETMGFQTALQYVERSGGRILRGTLSARTRTTEGSGSPARELQVVLARDQIMVLRALLVVQRSLRAILMVVVAAGVLALINPALTGVVALVTSLFVVPYYLVNRRMVGAATILEERNASARVSISRIVEHATSRDPNSEVLRVVPDLYAADVAISQRWAVLRDIMLGGQRTAAVMSGMVGTCLVAVVVAFSLIIASDGASWIAALTFIIGLNLASAAFVQLASLVTAANRFLPHVQDYARFLGTFAPNDQVASIGVRSEPNGPLPTVRAPDPILPASDTELSLSGETRVLSVWPGPVDRLNVEELLGRLVAGSPSETHRLREAAFFCGDPTTLPPVPIRTLLSDQGFAALTALNLEHEVRELPAGDATVLTPEAQEGLSLFLRYALGMLEGLDSKLLVLGWKSFARLTPEERLLLLEVIGQRSVLFVIAANPKRQPLEITHTVIFTEQGIAGMGTAGWYKRVVQKLQAESASKRPVGAVAGGIDDIADDA